MLLYLDVLKNSSNRQIDSAKFSKLRNKYLFYFVHRNLYSLCIYYIVIVCFVRFVLESPSTSANSDIWVHPI